MWALYPEKNSEAEVLKGTISHENEFGSYQNALTFLEGRFRMLNNMQYRCIHELRDNNMFYFKYYKGAQQTDSLR